MPHYNGVSFRIIEKLSSDQLKRVSNIFFKAMDPYAYGFDSLTINDTTINDEAGATISGISEGGQTTITYGYGPTGNSTFTDSTTESCTDANHTKYERQSFGGDGPGTFTFSTPGSYVVKAKTTIPRNNETKSGPENERIISCFK